MKRRLAEQKGCNVSFEVDLKFFQKKGGPAHGSTTLLLIIARYAYQRVNATAVGLQALSPLMLRVRTRA